MKFQKTVYSVCERSSPYPYPYVLGLALVIRLNFWIELHLTL